MEDIRVLAFFYIEQAALMGFVGMALVGIRLNFLQIVSGGILQGVVVYLSRSLCSIYGLPYGTHAFISFVSFLVFFWLITRKKWNVVFAAVSLAFLIVMISEGIMLMVILNHSVFELSTLSEQPLEYIVKGYLSDWLLLLLSFYLIITKRNLIKLEARDRKL